MRSHDATAGLRAFLRRILRTALVALLCTAPLLGSAPQRFDPGVVPELSQRINAFTLDFVKRSAAAPGAPANAVLSPQSVFHGLAMSYVAAGGQTRKELADALRLPDDEEQLINDLAELRRQFAAAGKDRRIEASMANALWLDETYAEFKKGYTQRVKRGFDAALYGAKFADAAATSDRINRWVARQTRDRIKNVIGPGDLRSRSALGVIDEPALVSVNAVYFKADWGSRFEARATRDLPFHVDRERTEKAPTMHQRSLLLYAADKEFQFLEIPYVDGRFSMYVLLPGEALSVAKLAEPLSVERITALRGAAAVYEVDVLLPKFSFRTHCDVKKTLGAMGVAEAFDKSKADFDRMILKRFEAYRIYLSDVFQDAFIEVHEKGAEAAAATTSVHYSIGCAAAPPHPPRVDFHADRPFVFAIVHNESRSVLFAGWISDPKRLAGGP